MKKRTKFVSIVTVIMMMLLYLTPVGNLFGLGMSRSDAAVLWSNTNSPFQLNEGLMSFDNSGNIWAASYGASSNVWKFNSSTGWMSMGWPGGFNAPMLFDSSGNGYVASQNSIYKYTTGSNWDVVTNLGKFIYSLQIDSGGNFWEGTGSYLYEYTPSNNQQTLISTAPNSGNISKILFDPNNSSIIWIVSGNSLYSYNKTNNQWTLYSVNGSTLQNYMALKTDKSGNVWVATQTNGIAKFSGGRFVNMNFSSTSNIADLAFDSANNPWILLSTGFVYHAIAGTYESEGTPVSNTTAGEALLIDSNDTIYNMVNGNVYAAQKPSPASAIVGWNPLQTVTINVPNCNTPCSGLGFDPVTKNLFAGYTPASTMYLGWVNLQTAGATTTWSTPGTNFWPLSNGKSILAGNSGAYLYWTDVVTQSQTQILDDGGSPTWAGSNLNFYITIDGMSNAYILQRFGTSSSKLQQVNGGGKTTLLASTSGSAHIAPFTDGSGVWVYDPVNYTMKNTATGKTTTALNNPVNGMPAITTGFTKPTVASKDKIMGFNSNGYWWTINSDGTFTEQYIGTRSVSVSQGFYPLSDGTYMAHGTNDDIFIFDPAHPTSPMVDTGRVWYVGTSSLDTIGTASTSGIGGYRVFAPDIYYMPSSFSPNTPTVGGYVIGTGQIGNPSIATSSSTQSSISVSMTTDAPSGATGYFFAYKLMQGSTVVASSPSNQGASYTLSGLPAGTSYTLQVQVSNIFSAGPWTTVGTLSTIPATPATPTAAIAGAGWTNNNGNDTVSVSWTKVTGATGYNIVLINGSSILQTVDAGNVTSKTISLPDPSHNAGYVDGSGNFEVAVQSYNLSNGTQQASPASSSVTLTPINQTDTTSPQWSTTNSIVINNGQQYTNTGTVPIAINATDRESGISQILVSNDNTRWTTFNVGTSTQGMTAAFNYQVTPNWQLPPGTGQKTVYIKLVDLVGNVSDTQTAYQGLQVNTVPPTVSLAINGGQTQTTSQNVTLTINAADPAYDASQLTMSFSNDGQTWTAPVSYQSSYTYTLPSSTTGYYPIFARVTDPAANTGIAYSSIYYLNTITAPIVGGGTGSTGGTIAGKYPTTSYNGLSNVYVVQSNQASLDFSGSGASYVSVSTDNISFSKLYPTSSPFTIYLPAGDGLKTVYAQLANNNNSSALGSTGKIYFLVDTTAPTLSVSGYNGATATSAASLNVQLNASDNLASLTQMQYQVDGGAWHAIPSNGVISISDFTQHSGMHTSTISVKDLAGNTTSKQITFWAA